MVLEMDCYLTFYSCPTSQGRLEAPGIYRFSMQSISPGADRWRPLNIEECLGFIEGTQLGPASPANGAIAPSKQQDLQLRENSNTSFPWPTPRLAGGSFASNMILPHSFWGRLSQERIPQFGATKVSRWPPRHLASAE